MSENAYFVSLTSYDSRRPAITASVGIPVATLAEPVALGEPVYAERLRLEVDVPRPASRSDLGPVLIVSGVGLLILGVALLA